MNVKQPSEDVKYEEAIVVPPLRSTARFPIYELRGVRFSRRGENGYYHCHHNEVTVCGESALHRAVWAVNCGPIPDGYHVHHKDENKQNNEFANLECMSPSEHVKLHGNLAPPSKEAISALHRAAAIWRKNNPVAASEIGRKARQGLDKARASVESVEIACDHCGTKFDRHPHTIKTNATRKFGNYCSRNCMSRLRYKLKIDHEERECVICESKFSIGKNQKTRTCGKDCRIALYRQSRCGK